MALSNIHLSFHSQTANFGHFGVCYGNIMYYLSTNPNTNSVKQFLDEGEKNELIKNSKIPNQHLSLGHTTEFQGHFLINMLHN